MDLAPGGASSTQLMPHRIHQEGWGPFRVPPMWQIHEHTHTHTHTQLPCGEGQKGLCQVHRLIHNLVKLVSREHAGKPGGFPRATLMAPWHAWTARRSSPGHPEPLASRCPPHLVSLPAAHKAPIRGPGQMLPGTVHPPEGPGGQGAGKAESRESTREGMSIVCKARASSAPQQPEIPWPGPRSAQNPQPVSTHGPHLETSARGHRRLTGRPTKLEGSASELTEAGRQGQAERDWSLATGKGGDQRGATRACEVLLQGAHRGLSPDGLPRGHSAPPPSGPHNNFNDQQK